MKQISFSNYPQYGDSSVPFRNNLFIDDSPRDIVYLKPGVSQRLIYRRIKGYGRFSTFIRKQLWLIIGLPGLLLIYTTMHMT